MKHVDTREFKVSKTTSLKEQPTLINNDTKDDEKKDALKEVSKDLSKLQEAMYANNRYSVLICLQGMDTSGKDSLIREIFKYFNARGVMVYSFKQPTSQELRHDYLWRHYEALPQRGKFGVFNRSHYENVIVTRVHPEYLLKENMPGIEKVEDVTDDFWKNRIESINNFEKHLAENGTIVLKFFLHLSKEEQRQRLLRRLELKSHNWKFSPGDLQERELWDKYQEYYEDALKKTSTPHAPWYVIPADDKKASRYFVAKIILDELQKYDIHEPEVDEKVLENINIYKRKLASEELD
ncbi:polyphosphate kinase 2 family protein [Flavobacterium arcticum]|uniref:Polyphosphate kinase 2 family protein n=1 Tax=Flavobacterium arcticum TaxID=1784713 RepID=A0A345H850_9FLAO|nr:PPK2 family polyphosphate kinase [Flavobacterium arcticum]AXG72760.1 polyphosphate kinase 2 family protein [Flavobacterium arcticum]KAF2510970.1 polyphosphate kinase 2 family protein [Flavobacterium arcticum]